MGSGPLTAGSSVRRLGILAQWSRDGGILPHVRVHLARLRSHCARLVLVSNSPLSAKARVDAERICDHVLERPNRGYDFAAWRDAILTEDVNEWDEVVLTNSSVIGPLFSLSYVFDEMDERPCDFWGMTYSRSIAPHIQSYFLVFRKPVLRSASWSEYWSGIDDVVKKNEIIRKYEINLMRYFEERGFHPDTQIQKTDLKTPDVLFRRLNTWLPIWLPLDRRKADPTIFSPYELIASGMPYLKASLLWTHHRRQGCPIEKIKALQQVDYPWHELGV